MKLMQFLRSFARSTFLIGTLSSVTCGCVLTVPSEPNKKDDQSIIDEKRIPAEDIWEHVAIAVQQRTINKTTQLAQVVLVLVKNGDLSELDAKQFDAKFPTATTMERDLGDADIVLLRSLK